MNADKIFLVGAAGAGKSEAKAILAECLKLQRRRPIVAAETGDVVLDKVATYESYGNYPEPTAKSPAAWRAYILSDKRWYRGRLRAMGDIMTDANPRALIDPCLSADLIVGVRRRSECLGLYAEALADLHSNVQEILRRCRLEALRVRHAWIRVERPDMPTIGDSFEAQWFQHFCPFNLRNTTREDLAGQCMKLAAALSEGCRQ